MNTNSNVILVTGATGHQGGASARHLLANGWRVRALVRKIDDPAARALAEGGVELVQGDMADRASLDHAMRGVYGVHSVQAYLPKDAAGEIHQGSNVADAAKAAGVQHLVYSSAAGPQDPSDLDVPEISSKRAIENHIRASGLPFTFLRPVYLMDTLNFLRSYILQGTWTISLPADRAMQMLASEDIGAFAALAFEHPERWLNQSIELAGDELSQLQIAEVLSRVIGRSIRFVEMPIEQARAYDVDLAKVTEWINTEGFHADIPALRAIHPALMTLETWLRKNGWQHATA
jgi:uncharacterized protein YbjT (DUF2867 family)